MFKKLMDVEPVVVFVVLIVTVMIVQKLWLGEAIDNEFVEWLLGILGLATGAGVVRQSVFSRRTVKELGNDHTTSHP